MGTHVSIPRHLICAFAVALAASSCSSRNPERQQTYVRPGAPAVQTVSIPFDTDDRRDRAKLMPEETLVVRLESRGGVGDVWELSRDGAEQDVVEVLSRPEIRPPPPSGPPPIEPKWDVFSFRALRPGTTTLRFNRVHLTDPNAPPDRRAEVTVEVNR